MPSSHSSLRFGLVSEGRARVGRSALVALALLVASCAAPAAAPPLATTPVPSTAPTASTVATTTTPTLGPTSSPIAAPTTPPGPVAYCAVADVPTPNIAYDEHVRTYLDWTYALPESYVPPDLVYTANGAVFVTPFAVETVGAAEVLARRGDPSYQTLLADAPSAAVRKVAYTDVVALRATARAEGHPLVILSAYRSYALQVQTFDYWTRVGGYQQALRTSARPGHSEHQLGTAIDFGDGSAAPWEYDDWAATPTGAWLAAHAAEFGFVQSFPKGKTDVTCYDYEPWHYRYVGKALAQTIVERRVALREYQSGTLR